MPLTITQYARQAADARGFLPAGEEPNLGTIEVATGGSSTQSATLDPRTRFVMLCADVTCSFAVGSNPTAVVTGPRLPANQLLFIGIEEGLLRPGTCEIAAIARS